MQLKETIFGDGMKKEGLEKGKITFGGMMAQDAKEPEEISEEGRKFFVFVFFYVYTQTIAAASPSCSCICDCSLSSVSRWG